MPSFTAITFRNWYYINKKKKSFVLVKSCWIFCSPSVCSLGARKQSTQFNNHSGCLNQPSEGLLAIYFSCIKLHLLFNFMAKWTSPISCPIPRLSQHPSWLRSLISPFKFTPFVSSFFGPQPPLSHQWKALQILVLQLSNRLHTFNTWSLNLYR